MSQNEAKGLHLDVYWCVQKMAEVGYREGNLKPKRMTKEEAIYFDELEDIKTKDAEIRKGIISSIAESMCTTGEWFEFSDYFTIHKNLTYGSETLVAKDGLYNGLVELAMALKLIRYGKVKLIYEREDDNINDERNDWDVIRKHGRLGHIKWPADLTMNALMIMFHGGERQGSKLRNGYERFEKYLKVGKDGVTIEATPVLIKEFKSNKNLKYEGTTSC